MPHQYLRQNMLHSLKIHINSMIRCSCQVILSLGEEGAEREGRGGGGGGSTLHYRFYYDHLAGC